MNTIRGIGIVWLLISLCWVSTGWSQSQGLVTIRTHQNNSTGLVRGNGYRLSENAPVLKPCVSFTKTQKMQDGAEYVSEFSFVKSPTKWRTQSPCCKRQGECVLRRGASRSYSKSKKTSHKMHQNSRRSWRMCPSESVGVFEVQKIKLLPKYVEMLKDPATRGEFVKECGRPGNWHPDGRRVLWRGIAHRVGFFEEDIKQEEGGCGGQLYGLWWWRRNGQSEEDE